jgi:hypothetical protein
VLVTDQLDRSLRFGNVRFAKLYEKKGSIRGCGNRHTGWIGNDRIKGDDRPLLPALASSGRCLNGELARDVFDQFTSRGMTRSIGPHRSAPPMPIANLREGFRDPKHRSSGIRRHQDERRPLPAQGQKPQLLQLERGQNKTPWVGQRNGPLALGVRRGYFCSRMVLSHSSFLYSEGLNKSVSFQSI